MSKVADFSTHVSSWGAPLKPTKVHTIKNFCETNAKFNTLSLEQNGHNQSHANTWRNKHFLEWDLLYTDFNFSEFCFLGSNCASLLDNTKPLLQCWLSWITSLWTYINKIWAKLTKWLCLGIKELTDPCFASLNANEYQIKQNKLQRHPHNSTQYLQYSS